MKKLKNKILITIFIILSISITSVLIVYNTTNYIREKNNIIDNLNKMSQDQRKPNKLNDKTPPEPPEGETEMKHFMDIDIYTIILNNNNEISEVLSHTKEETTPIEITNKATEIIKKNTKEGTNLGNLYLSKYSYKYEKYNNIIIMDITDTNNKLKSDLLISILIFIIFELIAFLISSIISKWIITPVEVSFKKQKQFIADASHELKTPLSVIMASAEAYEKDNNDKWIKNIETESNRMSKLIKDLLDLAKLEDDELPKLYETIDLSKLTEKAILPLESLIYEKDIKLEYNIEDSIIWKCNSDEIKQLIAILLDNAIKHCTKKGTITINLKKVKDTLILDVKNTGDPIPKGEEEKIFERFYRVDKSRNRKENRYGLGLAIAKSIVERHNGTIKASSNNNETIFQIILKK